MKQRPLAAVLAITALAVAWLCATVAAFYTSNVEVYLGPARKQFVANVKALPRDEHSMFIRTRFNAVGHTRGRPDYKTTTLTEPIQEYVYSWHAVEAQ